MPSPRKRAVQAAKNKLKVKVFTPSRQSVRIKANAEIKSEPDDDDVSSKKKNPKKKPTIKSKGKTVQAATSVKEKAKKIAASKKRKSASDIKPAPKMSVLALAAARKRKLNGEDDDEPPRLKRVKKKVILKKAIKKKGNISKKRLNQSNEFDGEADFIKEEVVEETYDDQPMVAVKQEDEQKVEEEEVEHFDEDEAAEEDDHSNLLINEEHQYIDQLQQHHLMNEHGEIEVPQEQVQAELQQENEEDEDEAEDDEDIDENLFFGIPEQRSPELATCTHCKGKFRKEDVHEHMLTCPERYVQCRECGKILSNLQTLERHHKRFHLKIREVPCTLCDKMFIDEAAARKHLKTVHFKVKNFHCPHCDKSFSQRNKLTYHVRTHSGEKPYSCAECGRSFSLLWNLKTHLRTHTGEKPYACDTCGRRFTQKQNMTSHLTTHRKPKSDKSFRTHFPSDLDDYDNTASGIISTDFSSKSSKNYRAYEQAKQLGAQSIGSGHYVLGDMQSIEVHTAGEQEGEQNVGLEHGLGLLSSVARKGDSTDVQVDGIVNIPDSQLSGSNLDQVVEVLIRSNSETDKTGNQLNSGNQSRIILDPNTQSITDADGQEIPIDTNTAAGLANILQNPDVLAAINNAASTNKFIVIGPVSMFDGSNAQSNGSATLSTTDSTIGAEANTTFTQEQLAQILAQQEQNATAHQVSSQTVNDSISATTALAAMENYLQGEQPSSSLSKTEQVVNNIMGSIQPDGKSGPSAVVQSAQAANSRASNLTISMPPMSQNTLTISPANLAINADSTQRMKSLTLTTNISSSSEVSSSVDNVALHEAQHIEVSENMEVQQQMEAESTTQPVEFSLVQAEDVIDTATDGVADSTGMVGDPENEASSSGEPILMLSTDENGQPQIIVRMPDGSETIMSDPALAESLIQVPTITNAEIEGVSVNNEAEPVQSISIDQMTGAMQLQLPDQGIPQPMELPTQSSMEQQFTVSQSTETSEQNMAEEQQLPDQSLDSVPTLPSDNVDSSENVELVTHTQQDVITESSDNSNTQTPDSSSQSFQRVVAESHIDSRQGVFVMEHVSGSDQPAHSDFAEQSNIDFTEQENTEFTVDSSSNNDNATVDISGNNYLQLDDISQSTNAEEQVTHGSQPDVETVTSTDHSET